MIKLRISEGLAQKRPQKEQKKLSKRRQQFHSRSKLFSAVHERQCQLIVSYSAVNELFQKRSFALHDFS